MLYELTTLSCPLLATGRAAEAAAEWTADPGARGSLLGLWRSELGPLGRVYALRSFEEPEHLSEERRRALTSSNPFNGGADVTGLEMDSYAPFPFLPPIRTGERGGIYELRTYRLRPGGLPPTLAGWEAAILPARDYTRHLVTAMFALDGAPRITHIWVFESLEQRSRLRAAAYGSGAWPPKGGPDSIAEAVATIGLPVAGSPLR